MLRIICFVICSSFLFLESPPQQDWRGLLPLKSTRKDVERLLGPPDVNQENQLLVYYQKDQVVFIGFSGNPQCRQKLPYTTWDTSMDTVTEIRVRLRKSVPIADTQIDLTKLKKHRGDSDLMTHFYYVNEENGFSIEVGAGNVTGYVYEPTSRQNHLQCPLNQGAR